MKTIQNKLKPYHIMLNYLSITFLSLLLISELTIAQENLPTKDINETGSYTAPTEYEIGGITVSGAKFLDKNVIISISGLKAGDKVRIPGEEIGKAIRKLWKQGILGDIEISITEIQGNIVFLNIHLSERPRVTRYNFYGVSKSQRNTLSERIGNIRGKVLTDALLKNTELNIRKYYEEKGFYNLDLNIQVKEDNIVSNSVSLDIRINKNGKVRVKDIQIDGNSAFSDKKIRKKLKTKRKKRIAIFRNSKFIENKFEEDKDKLIAFYSSKGYRDASILMDTVYSVKDEMVKIEIQLEEGKKYYYGDITWAGNYLYDDETLAKILGIRRGDIYNPVKLEEKLNFSQTELDISSLYMDDGYLFFSVTPVEMAVREDSIDVEIRIYEGPQADINKVILKGNTKTSDHVVLREIRTIPGRKFSRSDLIRSQREIAVLGYFDPEQTGINPIPHPEDGTVDIEYTVVEKPSDQVELSGGWGGRFGFVGTVGLVFNNFSARKIANLREWRPLPSGDGQRLSLRVQANGRKFQTYSFAFTEPWLGGKKPNAFTISLSHSVQRNIIRGVTLGSLKVTGLTFSLGRRLRFPDDFFTLTNSISYLRYDLENFGNQLGFSTGIAENFNFNTTLARNSIDNPTFPRNGSSFSLSLTLTPPYSMFDPADKDYDALSNAERFRYVEYHKWMFDSAWYTTLVGNLVLSSRLHFGFIGSYTPNLGIGPFDRFQLGGDGLTGFNFLLGTEIIGLRGYQNNSIVPLDAPQGGITYNKFVMELRYPLSLNPAATIFVLAFLEGGNTWSNYDEYNPFNFQRSFGVGARIFMPAFGLLGIDWGYGIDEVPGRPGVNEGQFHFTIGQQIR